MIKNVLTVALAASLCFSFSNSQTSSNRRRAAFSSRPIASTHNLGSPQIGVQYCQTGGAVINTGVLLAFGSEVAANNDVSLVATGLPINSVGFFIVGETRDLVHNPGGSQGDLCVGGKIGRFNGPGQIQNSGSTGAYSIQLDLTQFPMNPNQMVMAGQTWRFQSWYRMPLPPVPNNSDSDFTNAVEIVFQ